MSTKQAEQPIDIDTKHMIGLHELFSLKQLVKEPTRVPFATSSIIDHIATAYARNIIASGVHKISLTDQYVVSCIRKFDGDLEQSYWIIKIPPITVAMETHFARKRAPFSFCHLAFCSCSGLFI